MGNRRRRRKARKAKQQSQQTISKVQLVSAYDLPDDVSQAIVCLLEEGLTGTFQVEQIDYDEETYTVIRKNKPVFLILMLVIEDEENNLAVCKLINMLTASDLKQTPYVILALNRDELTSVAKPNLSQIKQGEVMQALNRRRVLIPHPN